MLGGVLPGQGDLAFPWVYCQHRCRLICVSPGQSPVPATELQDVLSGEVDQAMHHPGFDAFWIKCRGHFTLPSALNGSIVVGQ